MVDEGGREEVEEEIKLRKKTKEEEEKEGRYNGEEEEEEKVQGGDVKELEWVERRGMEDDENDIEDGKGGEARRGHRANREMPKYRGSFPRG